MNAAERDPAAGTVRLGLLGCADIALRRVLPAVARTGGIALTAVAARDAARAAQVAQQYGAVAAAGYAELLERDDVDAVYVPLPSALHAEWTERALLAGKHVLAEKPLTLDAGETARLVDLARSRGLVLMENFMFVHHPQHRRVRQLLDEGAIGELRTLHAAFAIPPRPDDDIRYRADLGGGALFDVGVYPLRAAQLLLGPGLEVTGADLRTDAERGVDVAGSVLLRRHDGVTAHLTFGMEHHYTSRYEVLGSTGRLRLDHAFTPPAGHRPVVVVERQGGVEELELEPFDQVTAAVRALVTSIGSGAGTTTGEATVRHAELVADVHRAGHARRGRAGTARRLAEYAVGGEEK
ncbi:Gfo/Idh/MocA family protein [Streptomyces roseifaciens]|uniref:Gfo/Idh/MocA family protein n=1 Tax=Streptomyces roseifaciens TaxID=1488406 RepID=UPI0007C7A0FB|nr:Gfo/Idh/MocA family oxidoreductase [Streptomyces roseifaciens]